MKSVVQGSLLFHRTLEVASVQMHAWGLGFRVLGLGYRFMLRVRSRGKGPVVPSQSGLAEAQGPSNITTPR